MYRLIHLVIKIFFACKPAKSSASVIELALIPDFFVIRNTLVGYTT
jgi:hypothetical protein